MINDENIRTAIQTAIDAVVAVDSGVITAGVSSPGVFTRQTGSFLTDGFLPNSEVTVSGFSGAAANGVWLVQQVAALALTVRRLDGVTLSTQSPTANARFRIKVPSARKFAGFKFDNPPALRPWVRGTLKTVSSKRTTLVRPARVKNEGLYLLDLFYPLGYGTAAAAQIETALKDALGPGTHLTYGGDKVSLMAIKTAGELEDESFVQLPITIEWWAFGWTLP